MTTAQALPAEQGAQCTERHTSKSVHDVAAVAILAVCAVIVHRDGLFGGPAFYELDTRLFYYPLANWVSQQLHAGVFPLWLPGIFTGYPIFADGELGLSYPLQVALLSVLPAPLAIVWLRVVHIFLAGLFTYLFLRTLRLDPLAALGGGLVFAYGSFLSAQMHHENVIRSAIWLPAVLTCVERCMFRAPHSAFIWSAAGALAFSQAALGLHVQPVLMTALALGAYCVFRALLPAGHATRDRRNVKVSLLSGATIVVLALGLAAVQWGPLIDWALVSFRREGVAYVFASAFGLPPQNAATVLFPFFFRLPDATTWWSLWTQWEIELYVGIPTLALVLVGIIFARRSEVVYFVALGALSLLIAMAQYAPGLNLHERLWSVPGFSFLRAPGRFSYLVVFACAGLAGLGLQALADRRFRPFVALVGGAPAALVLAATVALFPTWRAWLMQDPARARQYVESTYLATRAQFWIDPQLVVNGLVSSLDLSNVKTAWSLVLLAATGLSFLVWAALGHRRTMAGQAIFVALVAIDLLTFASDFHPRAALTNFAPVVPPGVDPGSRVLLLDSPDLPSLEPNQLLASGVATVQGYSSLPSQRHIELVAETSTQPGLFDLWSAPFIVEPTRPTDLHEVDGVRFRARHPLSAGFGGASASVFRIPTDVGVVSAVRLIGTLSYAFPVPQGQTVANLSVDGQSLPIRAGIELAERAYDRPSLAGLVQHQKTASAFDFPESTESGEAYIAHLYEVTIPFNPPVAADRLTLVSLDPTVLVEIYGIGLIDATGNAHALDLSDRNGFRRVGPNVIRNDQTLPRAYLLPREQGFATDRHPRTAATQLVSSPDMNVHTMVLIERDLTTLRKPNGSQPAVAATGIEDQGPNTVHVTATADKPSYLILNDFYQRGWTARVDGRPTDVYIANALFRAVAVEPGTHEVEFRIQPLSLAVGGAISAVSLLAVLAMLGVRIWHR